ncbi:MAG TPA: shikimate dehydrogenase [Clostridiaceae bacterium]|nr:shikimate dehydrogenase [Clostridiaceae bacterium]
MYFIGVTTGQSSIMKIFPSWAKALGLDNTVIVGIDIGIHEDPEVYRKVVSFIKNDELSMGALVTTHKLDLYEATKDLFEYLDPYALMFGELSSISKLDGQLRGHAKDPITSGKALEDFVPENWWSEHNGDFCVIGAGGSAIAMGSYLMKEEFKGNYPNRIIVTNRSQPRLTEIERIFTDLDPGNIDFEYHLCPVSTDNDQILTSVKPYSVIVNATGLGKDRPGSPLTDNAKFPENSLVWEINYRGELDFMHQALAQEEEANLHVEDGWRYFIYGWTEVIAEVFHIEIKGEVLDNLDDIAKKFR